MKNNGFVRVASAMPAIKVADCQYNTNQIIKLIDDIYKDKASLIVFPELAITGYTCGDLFFQQRLLADAKECLIAIKHHSKEKDAVIIVGLPLVVGNNLFNVAAVICKGSILGFIPKSFLPNYNEFYEQRWFSSANLLLDDEIIFDNEIIPIGTNIIFSHQQYDLFKIGVEICEDLWTPIPPSTYHALNGAMIMANLSASNDLVGKSGYRKSLLANQSARLLSAYIYASSGFGESTTDIVFGGHQLIYENGSLLKENTRFSFESNYLIADVDLDRLKTDRLKMTSYGDSNLQVHNISYREVYFDLDLPSIQVNRFVDKHPFVPSETHKRAMRCEEIFSIQTTALAKRLTHINCKHVVIGLSGGLDSTLALLVCVKTFDLLNIPRKNIICVTMPGFGTTDRTYQNALSLGKGLQTTLREIPIAKACELHFESIGHDINIHDITYENTQARERTQILMDLSNKENGIVIGTGDLSELALGWATYNGDHMSMYGVNVSIPKTLVRYLVEYVMLTDSFIATKEVLQDILLTPVSPELLPPDKGGKIAQKTEEVVGPYELHDFFLYNMLRFGYTPTKVYMLAKLAFKDDYDDGTILKWLKIFYKRFFAQQFKRSCMPDGPKVGSICLSPRGDLRMPSDAVASSWLNEIEHIS
jgi:NAD+ synthase (glutamine-hydrolysing)